MADELNEEAIQASCAPSEAAAPDAAPSDAAVPDAAAPAVANGADAITKEQKTELNELLSDTFNSVLRVEERSLKNRITEGLSISDIHTISAVGLHDERAMGEVAARLNVTLATLSVTMSKLVDRGFVERERDPHDRRRVLVKLTRKGREVFRVHSMFHARMVDDAFSELDADEARILASALSKVKKFFDQSARQEA